LNIKQHVPRLLLKLHLLQLNPRYCEFIYFVLLLCILAIHDASWMMLIPVWKTEKIACRIGSCWWEMLTLSIRWDVEHVIVLSTLQNCMRVTEFELFQVTVLWLLVVCHCSLLIL